MDFLSHERPIIIIILNGLLDSLLNILIIMSGRVNPVFIILLCHYCWLTLLPLVHLNLIQNIRRCSTIVIQLLCHLLHCKLPIFFMLINLYTTRFARLTLFNFLSVFKILGVTYLLIEESMVYLLLNLFLEELLEFLVAPLWLFLQLKAILAHILITQVQLFIRLQNTIINYIFMQIVVQFLVLILRLRWL